MDQRRVDAAMAGLRSRPDLAQAGADFGPTDTGVDRREPGVPLRAGRNGLIMPGGATP